MSKHDSPTIYSLDEWEVPIHDDVAAILSKGCNLKHVLERMKLPPSAITCRLMDRSKIQEAEQTIAEFLQPWLRARSMSTKDAVISAHPILHDLLTIRISPELKKLGCEPPTSSLHRPVDDASSSGWPNDYKTIIVDRLTGEAILRGSNVFVRGVQAASSSVYPNQRVAVYASMTPIRRGLQIADYTGTCIYCGVGLAKASRADMFSKFEGLAVEMVESVGPLLPPMNDIESLQTKMILQNLPSCAVAAALAASVGNHQTILDMCACPGGKTSHLASLVPDDCHIIAIDKSRKKVLGARALFKHLGVDHKITPIALDSRKAILHDATLTISQILEHGRLAAAKDKDNLTLIKGFPAGSIDHILLDPPCSALGLRPKLDLSNLTEAYLESVVQYQKQFIQTTIGLLKDNGFMTYSTCTIQAAENEDMVRWILDTFPCMVLVPIPINIGGRGRPGTLLSSDERNMVRFFDPTDCELDTMGFFVAMFKKIKAS